MLFVLSILLLATSAFCDERIVSGSDISSRSVAPWQASLQRSSSHFCGGSLISSTHVMTACHCYNTGATVVLGTVHMNDRGTERSALSFNCHSSYSSTTIDYDYAVIRISSVSVIAGVIEPIAVASQEFAAGTSAEITGWGKTSGGVFGSLASTLQYAEVNLISQSQCRLQWGSMVTSRMQCAQNTANSACNGDSGGPLVVRSGGTAYLVGNTSWGASGCSTSVPSAWSKNSAVYSWINSQI